MCAGLDLLHEQATGSEWVAQCRGVSWRRVESRNIWREARGGESRASNDGRGRGAGIGMGLALRDVENAVVLQCSLFVGYV